MKKTRIKITHQLEKTVHHFLVVNPNKLSCDEVNRICDKIGAKALFVNGKYYES